MVDEPSVLAALDVGVFVLARDLRIAYANPRALEMLGVAEADPATWSAAGARWDLVTEDDRAIPVDELPGPRAIATGEPVRDVMVGVRRAASQERVWGLVTAMPVRDAAGEVTRAIITFSDVSRLQRAARATEARYRSIFAAMSEGIVIHDRSGDMREANPAAERILRVPAASIVGRRSADPQLGLVAEDGTALEPAALPTEIARTTGASAGPRVVGVPTRSGELAWVAVRADPIREPGDAAMLGVVATFTDVGPERIAARALEASRLQLQRVVDAVPCVVYQYFHPNDGPDSFQFVGGRIREVLGLDPAIVRDNPFAMFSILSAEEQQKMMAHIVDTVSRGVPFEYEGSFESPDVGTRWLRIQGLPEPTADGVLYTGVILDVTSEHRMAELLRQRQRREAMGEMAAGIAHNLNNMLAVILPNVELAREQATGDAVDQLGDAERAALSAADLVRRMLALGRTDPADLRDARADLAAVVREAVYMCRRTFDRWIRIEEEVVPRRAPVAGRASALQQLVLNLCLNARDALADRPAPTLSVKLESPGRDAYVLTVADTGAGMSPETLQRLGEPFFTTKSPGGGTGLGLASAFQTLTEIGGTWTVTSREGVGTTFVVRVPRVAAADDGTVRSRESSDRYPAAGGTVLVVDDEPMVREALSRQLLRAGYSPLVADGAEAALRVLRDGAARRLRAILLDVSMPGMSGPQAVPHLRAAAPDAAVFLLTGQAYDGTTDGVARALQKPLAQLDLETALREAARR